MNAKPGYGYVCPNLAIGSKPPIGRPLPFDVLVLTAWEVIKFYPGYASPESFPGTRVLYVPLDDATIPLSEATRALDAGRKVATYVRHGKRVLVTCNQGRNRSGLVTAFALMDLGYPSTESVRRIRKARGDDALSNDFFVRLLHQLDVQPRGRRQEAATC
jgi:hypothetical protein